MAGELTRTRKLCLGIALLLPLLLLRVEAQVDQLVPEIDVHYKLTPDLRATFQVKESREGGDPVQAELGPSVELYLKPLIRLKNITALDLDDSKSRALALSLGYRRLASPNSASVNRIEPVATLHFPLKAALLLSDRNRADLDWKNGNFMWRYRNRVQFERRLTLHGYHPAPYASVEVFYQSQYGKWSDTAIYAGCLLPMGKHVEFDPYYEHQNNTGKSPNQRLNQFGFVASISF